MSSLHCEVCISKHVQQTMRAVRQQKVKNTFQLLLFHFSANGLKEITQTHSIPINYEPHRLLSTQHDVKSIQIVT